jgi:hypothetical protein
MAIQNFYGIPDYQVSPRRNYLGLLQNLGPWNQNVPILPALNFRLPISSSSSAVPAR